MVNIQSPTAEIRRGKKKKKKKERRKKQDENIMVCPITYRATIITIWQTEDPKKEIKPVKLWQKQHC